MKDKHLVWLLVAVCCIGAFWLLRQPSAHEEQSPDDRAFIRERSRVELNQAIKEINRRLQYAIALNDQRAIATYSPMAYRLAEIRRRMENTKGLFGNYDATDDLAEIREIKAKLGR